MKVFFRKNLFLGPQNKRKPKSKRNNINHKSSVPMPTAKLVRGGERTSFYKNYTRLRYKRHFDGWYLRTAHTGLPSRTLGVGCLY